MALAYNLVHQLMIKNVSAVATTVLGEVKIVALLLLSATLLGERWVWVGGWGGGGGAQVVGLAG
jgi:hypothetical protein